MTTDFDAGNDVRALLAVHDGLRSAVPAAARHVRALRPGDRRAARALARWWEAVSAALLDHRAGADSVLWPVVLAAAPTLAGEVRRLRCDHDRLDADLALVTVGFDRLGQGSGSGAEALRINLAATIARFDIRLRRHLAAQETLALPVVRHAVPPADWVAPAALFAAQAGRHDLTALVRSTPAHRRGSAPVRALQVLVCGPRYRRPAVTR